MHRNGSGPEYGPDLLEDLEEVEANAELISKAPWYAILAYLPQQWIQKDARGLKSHTSI